jgi:uncharacterized protein (UPF0264 family)
MAALDGDADIVDAKEPAHGCLGAVEPAVLAAISEQLLPTHPFSLALGDFAAAKDIYAAVSALPALRRPVFVKIGFAGLRTAGAISELIVTAREAASKASDPPRFIAVAYADADQVDAPDPWEVCEAARRGGATGILLDTAKKSGGTVLDLMPLGELSDWVSLAHLHELTAGVAGNLRLDDFEVVAATGADIVGVRGAACDGGRTGTVSAQRVAALVAALRENGPELSGETPESPFGTALR